MIAFRIADRRFPIFNATGAFLRGGRWNSPGRPVLYAAQTYAGALVEVLVHAEVDSVPKTHAVIRIDIPDDISTELLDTLKLPDWASDDRIAARAFGDRWIDELRSAVLLVPSVVLQGRESNVLINPAHPRFPHITASGPEPVIWDSRLFSRRG